MAERKTRHSVIISAKFGYACLFVCVSYEVTDLTPTGSTDNRRRTGYGKNKDKMKFRC